MYIKKLFFFFSNGIKYDILVFKTIFNYTLIRCYLK